MPATVADDVGWIIRERVPVYDAHELEFRDRKSGDVSRADVASVVIATLGNPDATGKTFELITDPAVPREAWRSQFRRLAPDVASR